jgi:hypothetical protein
MLIPLALNELLDRPSILSFNAPPLLWATLPDTRLFCFREACLTPELTGREVSSNSTKLSMEINVTPLRLNELLGAPSLEAFNSRLPNTDQDICHKYTSLVTLPKTASHLNGYDYLPSQNSFLPVV